MIKLICEICKKEFYTYPCRTKSAKKYCSRPCMNIGHKGLHRGKEIKKGQHLSPKTQFKKGQPSRNYKGGYRSSDGYLWIWKPNHHKARKSGYVLNSILIVEKIIGRYLLDSEMVHHINENKSDDKPENLKVMTKTEHKSFHAKKRWDTNTFR